MSNNKLRDMVYGFAVGDALGVPYEFRDRDTFKCAGMIGGGTWNQPAGTWSDDTALLLATCDSIKACGGVDVNDMMKRFAAWLCVGSYAIDGKVFDIGNTTEQAINRYVYNGIDPLACGIDNEQANGNGSLMRILPLAFVDGAGAEQIYQVSMLTHAHRTSLNACCTLVKICRDLIRGGEIPSGYTFGVKRKAVKSTGYVVDTLNAALWCVAKSKSYRDAVLTAVNLGGDTDTIAAITGGIAAVKYGIESIPERWLAELRGQDIIEKCLFTCSSCSS